MDNKCEEVWLVPNYFKNFSLEVDSKCGFYFHIWPLRGRDGALVVALCTSFHNGNHLCQVILVKCYGVDTSILLTDRQMESIPIIPSPLRVKGLKKILPYLQFEPMCNTSWFKKLSTYRSIGQAVVFVPGMWVGLCCIAQTCNILSSAGCFHNWQI
jgi:hypothetical protein